MPMKLKKGLSPILSTTLILATLFSSVKVVTSQGLGSTEESLGQSQKVSYRFPIQLNSKWGYIDRTGKVIVQPQFDGLAPIQVGIKLGFIDRTGKIVVKPQFDYALVCKNHTENSLIQPHSVDNIQSGLISIDLSHCHQDLILLINKNNFEYVDMTGKLIDRPPLNKEYADPDELIPVQIGQKWGYRDRTGKIVIEAKFDMIFGFKEGLSQVVMVVDNNHKKIKYGYIDRNGKYAIELQQLDNSLGSFGGNFSEGFAKIAVRDKWGYINRTGKTVIKPQFYEVSDFKDGLARIKDRDLRWGYIDRNGKIVIKPQFNEAFDFHNGLAMVIIGEKRGYIDRTGKYIWQPSE
jgi:WG containing repeat